VNSIPFTFVSDGFEITIPLSVVGDKDGRFNFKVVSASRIRIDPNTYTGVLDWMPDLGLLPGMVVEEP
jgi:hypothetical protein